uniref:Prolyl 4-hydroxylase subunit alpha 3 n=1 Tax=Laticauda laticaudata TaxID=8630 RepID=A0A8C5RZI1_LATLA
MLRAAGRLLGLLGLLGALGGLRGAPGETFSSMLSIRRALGTEGALLGHLRSYLEHEASRLRDLDRFYQKIQVLHQGSSGTMANPLMAFALIKRLQSDWRNVVYSLEGSENIQALKVSYHRLEDHLPLFEDLEGAARALMRLQDVYALSVKELARGRFQTTNGANPDLYHPRQDFVLSADDCFHIGKVAYDQEDYYHSIPWMEEAVRLFRISYGNWNTEDEGSLEEALDHLAFSYFMAGNISHALKLSQEFLHYDPGNERMARNVLKYEKLLRKDQEEGKGKITLQRPNVTHLETRDAYEALCQRLGSQPAHRRLSCSYETNHSPWLILQPLKKEILHPRPELALYHDFLSPSEAEKIKALAAPGVSDGGRLGAVKGFKFLNYPFCGRGLMRWGQSEVGLAGSPNYSKFLLLVLQNWSELGESHLWLGFSGDECLLLPFSCWEGIGRPRPTIIR